MFEPVCMYDIAPVWLGENTQQIYIFAPHSSFKTYQGWLSYSKSKKDNGSNKLLKPQINDSHADND